MMEAWWPQITDAIRADFSDVPNVGHLTQIVVRLLMAALLGGLLGFERERAGKPAGMRTSPAARRSLPDSAKN